VYSLEFLIILKIIFIGLLTGTLIGTVGVGGILLAPFLVNFLGTELHIALATSSFSFLFTGIVGVIVYARRKSINWQNVFWIGIGVIPAALLGARVNALLSSTTLTLILAVLIMISGYNSLIKQSQDSNSQKALSKAILIMIGVFVGFGSALTGTGGPVLLLPILLLFGFVPLAAIGISQAIQVPIAVFATAGYIIYGQIDFTLGITLGIVQAVGVVIGGIVAHTLPREKLRMIVAVTLIGVGLLMIGRLLFDSG
jgi:uncharacterized membrane protein YfcA